MAEANSVVHQVALVGLLGDRSRPATALIVAFIYEHIGGGPVGADGSGLPWGVESVNEQLTVWGHEIGLQPTSSAPARPPSGRWGTPSKAKFTATHTANFGVLGAREVWLTFKPEGAADEATMARCTVERLTVEIAQAGAGRGKVKRTKISGPANTPSHTTW